MDNDDNLVHAGCVAGPVADDAGCVGGTRDEGQTAATPTAGPGSGGSAPAPASDDASTKATPPQTVREFERALRALGYTRLQAASIARQGYSGATATEAAAVPGETEQLCDALQRFAQVIKGSSS
jgi:hypothetical protein